MKKMKRKVKGFTLVELVICIAIIAILVSIAIPQYNKARLSAIVATHNSNVQSIKSAAILTRMEDEKVEIDKDSVSKNIEGGKLPDINKAIKEATGVSNWNISEDKESGNIIIEPGLVKFDGSKIIKVD
ncbi:type IV pilin protein [Neofamilia massiliensis]|uniref:type IV pilin protein n=1 Tax=Neofamilia massiliensis TaxID=1673724 RepID=UPI0006BB70A1|nr:prepilin-type N-terminal cleavage/methylation domain-containing protein [Neofamilia massiliensis]